MNINIKALKFKIFAISLIPVISIVYFTFFYVRLSDANIEIIEQQKLQEAYKNSDASLALLLETNPNLNLQFNKIPYIRKKSKISL